MAKIKAQSSGSLFERCAKVWVLSATLPSRRAPSSLGWLFGLLGLTFLGAFVWAAYF